LEDIDQSQAFAQVEPPLPPAAEARPDPDLDLDPDTAWLGDMATNEPTWFDQWGRRAAIWLSGSIAAAFVLIGALWLYGERKIDSAMAVLAMSSRTPVDAPPPSVVAEKAAATVPPLVMLPREEVEPPSRPSLKTRPARAAAVPAAAKSAARANRPGLKTAVTKRAAKPAPVRKRRAGPVLASVSHTDTARAGSAGRPQKIARAAPTKRCRTGDLARDCLVDLCEGERDRKACRAAARLGLR